MRTRDTIPRIFFTEREEARSDNIELGAKQTKPETENMKIMTTIKNKPFMPAVG